MSDDITVIQISIPDTSIISRTGILDDVKLSNVIQKESVINTIPPIRTLHATVPDSLVRTLIVNQGIIGSSSENLNNIELEFAYSINSPEYFKEYNYVGENISGYDIYSNDTKNNLIFAIHFTYLNDDLIQKTIHKIEDDRVLTIDFNYLNQQLVSQRRSLSL